MNKNPSFLSSRFNEDEALRAVIQADNPIDVVRYKFDQVFDQILLEFVHTKLVLLKKAYRPQGEYSLQTPLV